jgi:hypothetical protein
MYQRLSKQEKEILNEIRDATYETLTRGKDEKGIPFLKYIFELHYKIFGETCSSCPGKITGYIQKLKNFNPKIKMEIIKSEFQLQENVIIPVSGTSDVYSKHNLTDEAALKLLAENPNRKSLFSKVPEDLEKRIEDYIANLEVEQIEGNQDNTLILIGTEKVSVDEAIALLELIGTKTKATTVTGVAKKIAELSQEQLNELIGLASDLVSKKQTSNLESIENFKIEYEAALAAFKELETKGTEDEKTAALKILEDAKTALEDAEKLINKAE